jgi:hypothetical protein
VPQAKTADRYDALKVRQLAMKMFQKSGSPAAEAAAIADRLVAADLAGKAAEGVGRIPGQVEKLRGEGKAGGAPVAIKSPTLGKPVAITLERTTVAAIQKEFDKAGVKVTLFNLRIREAA